MTSLTLTEFLILDAEADAPGNFFVGSDLYAEAKNSDTSPGYVDGDDLLAGSLE